MRRGRNAGLTTTRKRQVPIMISSGFGVLALFSLLSMLFGEDRRGTADRNRFHDDMPTSWFDPLH